MRKFFAVITLVAALAGKLSGCAQDDKLPAPTPTPTEATVETVYTFQDSLGAQNKNRCTAQSPQPCVSQADLWAEHPEYSVSMNSEGGTWLADWHKRMHKLPADSTVSIELATNNLLNTAWNTGEVQADMIETLNILRAQGVTRTVWVNLNELTGQLRGEPYKNRPVWMNQWMRDLVASGEYADIGLEIADWNAVVQLPGNGATLMSEDRLHHNIKGNNLFAQFLVNSVIGEP